MRRFKQAAEEVAASHPKLFDKDHTIINSYDSDQIHKGAKQMLSSHLAIGEDHGNRLPLPLYSPDMHKVLEHTHALVVHGMMAKLRRDRAADKGIKYYKQLCKQVFFSKVTKEGVRKDVKSLKRLYHFVKGKRGEYAPSNIC